MDSEIVPALLIGFVFIFSAPLIVTLDAYSEPVLSARVDPLNAAPGTMPLIEDTFSASEERIWKRPVPTTSKVVAGVAVPTPTFDVLPAMYRVGVARACVEGQERAGAPASKTILPVVWRRI